jgi:hypothetical protein
VAPSREAGKTRSFYALINGANENAFTLNSPIPAITSVLGTGLVTASTSYSDPSISLTAVASAGTFRVTAQPQWGGFTVVLENIQFKAKDGTVYVLNGEATVLP